MNKKFSTLIASLLLAGGAFSSAWAEDFNNLLNNGKYYKIVRTAYYYKGSETKATWKADGEDAKYYLGATALTGTEDNAALWKFGFIRHYE